MDSDTGVTNTFSELSQSYGEKSSLYLHIDDFVIAKVHIIGSKDKTKHFIEKICNDSNNNGDFEMAFSERSRMANGFIFPFNEDLASICRKIF